MGEDMDWKTICGLGLVLAATPALARETPPDVSAQVSAAQAAEDAGNYKDAIRLWTPLAESGLPEAETHMGYSYLVGRGVCMDRTKARAWFTKAADQGYAQAYADLGDMLSWEDPGASLAWYRKAADLKNVDAEAALSRLYWDGDIVPQDTATAIMWEERAALGGAIFDAYMLGDDYSDGRYVAEDDAKAVDWYRLAATHGVAAAQFELGKAYETGRGVTADIVAAYMWYGLAVVTDAHDGGTKVDFAGDSRARDAVAARMTPEQLAKARQLVADSDIKAFNIAPTVTSVDPACDAPPPPPKP